MSVRRGRLGLLLGIVVLPGCDRVFGLETRDRLIDAALADSSETAACFSDPAYHPLGTIPESRYAAGTQPVSWLAARDECRTTGAHLVVASQLDAEWTSLIGGERLANSHWIGLSDFTQEVDFLSLTGELVGSRQPPWGANQPDRQAGEECVALQANTISDVTCDGPHVAGCECEPPVTCEPTADPFTRIYMVIPAATTWGGAHAACEAIGYRLAVPTSSEEFEAILGANGGGRLWIDATDRGEEGHWRTRDGCRPYLRWGLVMTTRPEPNGTTAENCAAIVDNSTMELTDQNCDLAMYSSLCETL